MSTAVVVADDGPVRRLRLNRPDKLNALNEAVRAGLMDAVAAVADDTAVRVVVLEGAGRAFSAGADLAGASGAASEAARPWAERRHRSGGWQRLLDAIEGLPQVTVAALHGHCIGGAALLAAACDLRVADATLQVRIPELAIGIPLTWGGVPRLAREIGLPLTRDLVMTGRTLDADAALACGFVQRLALAGELVTALDGVVGELLAMPAAPLAMTKALTAALGRERLGSTPWADADLLAWSMTEPEGAAAAQQYFTERVSRRQAEAGPTDG
jgi:enoyl-CoA hydratase/carnithine racemase